MAGELVLIVEDNEKNLKLARDVLQFHGFRTIEANTGEAAIELARAEAPDLILMDIQLPVVAVTAFAMKEDRERFVSAGFCGYLVKPIDIKTFPNQVRQFCDGAGG